MRLVVLDIKHEANAICYLCKVKLIDYINAIPNTYKEFEVQRGIVVNRYLDHLADTIHKQRHIPPIVLITDQFKFINNDNEIDVKNFKILDGLQRTHRLKVIADTITYLINQSNKSEIRENPSRFARENSSKLRELSADVKLVRSLVSLGCLEISSRDDFFGNNTIWLEVWTGLSDAQQVEKMLLLNAGHKAVNIKHQLELLFLSTLFKLENISPNGVSFIREKDQTAIQYSKSRKLGQFHFSHVISALIALSAGKVVNTNSDFISDLQANSGDYLELIEGFNLEFIKKFIEFLYELDKCLKEKYQDIGTKWLGREVVLIGFFAAIGEFAEERSESVITILDSIIKEIPNIVNLLDLNNFEIERNNVELNKVNVGNVNKRAVYRAIRALIRKETFSGWKAYFGSAS